MYLSNDRLLPSQEGNRTRLSCFQVLKAIRVLLLLMFFMLTHFFSIAQQLKPKWLDDLGGASGYAQVTYITVDKQNNIYVTGGFAGTVDFDPSAAVKNLTSVGGGRFL